MTLRLPAIDGLDTEVGLEATGGDRALYLRLLARFVELHQGDAASWPALLAAGDAALAIRQVHRLRGAAATLGLTRVTESTARFEQ
ncbi:MAG TPA: Hpt domain-containing protein, partial [Rubrivivax sp.]|nr:Hpt domain-containing protein [Rubrivivax sp.]